MSIVSLEDAAAQCNIPDDDTESLALLQSFVDGVGAAIEDYKHEVIEQREVVDRLRLSGWCRFRLWSVPVISVTSIISLDGATTWPVDQLDVDPATGLVEVVAGLAPCGRVKVTYQAGYETVPENYKRGALVAIQDVWETQRGVEGVTTGVADEGDYRRTIDHLFLRKARVYLGAPRPVVG